MYSAHRKLNPTRWEIINRNLTVLKTVRTKKQARAIVDAQDLNAKPAPASAKGPEKKEIEMNERITKRQNWRSSWKGYTWPSAHGKSRPQSNRKQRRQYWRDAWKEREPDEYNQK